MACGERPARGQEPRRHRVGEGLKDLVVGIGASAGGLEAFSRLLWNLLADSGMAFALVQPLDPQHPSLLGKLLAGKTAMPVHEASEGAEVDADNVYVVPPAQDLCARGDCDVLDE